MQHCKKIGHDEETYYIKHHVKWSRKELQVQVIENQMDLQVNNNMNNLTNKTTNKPEGVVIHDFDKILSNKK